MLIESDDQLRGADQRSKDTYQFIEPTSVEIYSRPNDYAMQIIENVAGSGIQVSILAQHIRGSIRL